MESKVKVLNDSVFLRFGEIIINRADVRGVHFLDDERANVYLNTKSNGLVLPRSVVECWFSDIVDYKPLFEDGKLK